MLSPEAAVRPTPLGYLIDPINYFLVEGYNRNGIETNPLIADPFNNRSKK
jgi:hypothetical protein